MKFVSSVLVLLISVVKLFAADHVINCNGNAYKNNPLLLPKLQGYLYTVYTSQPYSNNEIFKFYPIVKDNIFTRTTNDAKCCKTMNVSTKGKNSFRYTITNDKDCKTQLTEDAHMKLLDSNTDAGTTCIILWTCRSSREGVHAFCSKTKLSDQQRQWISKQYKQLRLKADKVVQNTDYKNGKCFNKKQ